MKTFNLETFGEELDNIIENEFGEKGKIFSNEEQFQFELALEIERRYQKDEYGYPRVRLEVLSYPNTKAKTEEGVLEDIAQLSKEDREKMYTDIVVDINDTDSIAIELKYKTLGGKDTKNAKGSKYYDYVTGSGTYRVFNQGASNLGCAYYLVDVERIEKLIALSKENKNVNVFDLCHPEQRRVVVKGYAIIITNDHLYWAKHKEGTDSDIFSLTDTDWSKGKGAYKK